MLSPDIHEDSLGRVGKTESTFGPIPEKESSKVDSGLSSIEKSKSVRPEMTPPMNIPILAAPSDQESIVYVVASVNAKGIPVTETMRSIVLQGEEIKNSMLESWKNNLREIGEYVKQMLSSPLYQQLQEIRQKGDLQQNAVSGVSEAQNTAAAASQVQALGLLSTIDRLQNIERVPETEEGGESTAPRDSAQVLVLPLTAALLLGAGFAVGATSVANATNPLGGLVELVQRLQPIFPQVGVQDLVPLINLMVVGPIYYNSWNEAVSNLSNHERHNYVQTAQNFAKDVIKMVTDPNFIQFNVIKRLKGADQLTPKDQERLSRMLKVILVGVALSLLYSVEVGKVQNGTFGGMEPEELRDLLTGKMKMRSDPNQQPTKQELMVTTLIHCAWEQLSPLSIEDREQAANTLLDYVSQNQDFNHMLDPAKVFDATLASSFKPQEKIIAFKV